MDLIKEAIKIVGEAPHDIHGDAARLLAREVERCHGFRIQCSNIITDVPENILGYLLLDMAHDVKQEFGTYLLRHVEWHVSPYGMGYRVDAVLWGRDILARVKYDQV